MKKSILVFAVVVSLVLTAQVFAAEQVYVPGLLAGKLSGDLDTVSPNPGNLGIDPLGPSLSEAHGAPQPPWDDYTTIVYTGQFFHEGGLCGFFEDIDDWAVLVVDGNVLLDDWHCATPTAWVGQLSAGWHDFELRMWNSGGGAGRWYLLGFGYDPTGDANGSTSWQDYVHPQNSDAFTANVFRTIAPQPPVADAGEDIIADANEEVILDASSSTDPDGEIAEYTWTALPEEEVLYSGPNSIFIMKAFGRVEEVIKLTVTDNMAQTSEDTVSIFNKRVEEIELTPGPEGPQGPQGEQGPQGPQGPPGITPEEIAQMQAQITILQQENAALLQQIQELQRIVEENRKLLERLPQIQKGLKK